MTQTGTEKVKARQKPNRYISQADPFYSTESPSKRFQDDDSPSNRDRAPGTYRSAPLVPQSTLFLRRRNQKLSMNSQGRYSRRYSDSGVRIEQDYFVGHSESASARRRDAER